MLIFIGLWEELISDPKSFAYVSAEGALMIEAKGDAQACAGPSSVKLCAPS